MGHFQFSKNNLWRLSWLHAKLDRGGKMVKHLPEACMQISFIQRQLPKEEACSCDSMKMLTSPDQRGKVRPLHLLTTLLDKSLQKLIIVNPFYRVYTKTMDFYLSTLFTPENQINITPIKNTQEDRA